MPQSKYDQKKWKLIREREKTTHTIFCRRCSQFKDYDKMAKDKKCKKGHRRLCLKCARLPLAERNLMTCRRCGAKDHKDLFANSLWNVLSLKDNVCLKCLNKEAIGLVGYTNKNAFNFDSQVKRMFRGFEYNPYAIRHLDLNPFEVQEFLLEHNCNSGNYGDRWKIRYKDKTLSYWRKNQLNNIFVLVWDGENWKNILHGQKQGQMTYRTEQARDDYEKMTGKIAMVNKFILDK
jgi:hypothetical protein